MPPTDASTAFTHSDTTSTSSEVVEAFRQRQQQDFSRRRGLTRRMHSPSETEDEDEYEDAEQQEFDEELHRQREWRNRDGEALEDFGVDEETEVYGADDDVPLAELIRRRKGGV